MSKRQGWSRQRWQDADAEIGQAIGLTVQADDQVRHLADELIEDSPYQSRVNYDEVSLQELARGMEETGFQGVIFVRPHPAQPSGVAQRYQLVYGHRRRLAWRMLCLQREQACMVPVIVRQMTDQQLLTIGAQENLQRQDLTPIEEAQLVVWHQKLYYPASLGDIGRLLGKTEDWAKTRSRVAQLPDPLKAAIGRVPTLMTSILEISRLWGIDTAYALTLVERAEHKNLNLRQIRTLVTERLAFNETHETSDNRRIDASVEPPAISGGLEATPAVTGESAKAPASPDEAGRDDMYKRRVDALIVPSVTSGRSAAAPVSHDGPSLGVARNPDLAIESETAQILAQLRAWEQRANDPLQRNIIGQSCQQLLEQLQQIIMRLEGE
ncbi:MAG: ParB/RepB/Spo0J family partition protein [Candidatus Viridilinea halotolerans]|uniref:ParB/RepB/Spo0J family partition protein n=1 Tax=Candidatus Viridilinea halotolerans TaxID=2491704 RepID=A0A426U2S7_9CHLR|nr:MAG: ParB/RepB/Spo0J family partition protein [Candidatus Viridilinea halotolerans]